MTPHGTYDIVPATIADWRRRAERRLPRFIFDYIDGGANDERTMAANVDDFARLRIRQRVMRDVEGIDTTTTLLGDAASLPLMLAPVGMAGLFRRRGEVQAVRAADGAGIPFTLSTVGICTLAEVAAAARRPFWFQLYMMRDRAYVADLLDRARANGCTTLVFTVDLAVAGMRHRDTRNGMLGTSLACRLGKARQLLSRPGWLWDVGVKGKPHSFGNIADRVADPTDLAAFRVWVDSQFDPSVTWRDIAWLRERWPGKLILKGILDAGDAREAADIGADGIVVSNHGGRQLDGVASSIAMLPRVVDAVGGRVDVLMDGGVRGGIDLFKALASGARGAMVGRPWVWALAAEGEAGVAQLVAGMRRELAVAMALAGVTRIDQIDGSTLEG